MLQATKELVSDRFLVQLSKLDATPGSPLKTEEIAALWDKVDKSKLVQYKLKVELSEDVTAYIQEPQAQGEKAVGSTNVNSVPGRESELFQSMVPGKKEESKEKTPVERPPLAGEQSAPGKQAS